MGSDPIIKHFSILAQEDPPAAAGWFFAKKREWIFNTVGGGLGMKGRGRKAVKMPERAKPKLLFFFLYPRRPKAD